MIQRQREVEERDDVHAAITRALKPSGLEVARTEKWRLTGPPNTQVRKASTVGGVGKGGIAAVSEAVRMQTKTSDLGAEEKARAVQTRAVTFIKPCARTLEYARVVYVNFRL